MEGLDMDCKRRFSLGIAAVILACTPVVHAQTASVSGILGSFDVVNQTGIDAHGFEIQ
jgi:hypothetical protein